MRRHLRRVGTKNSHAVICPGNQEFPGAMIARLECATSPFILLRNPSTRKNLEKPPILRGASGPKIRHIALVKHAKAIDVHELNRNASPPRQPSHVDSQFTQGVVNTNDFCPTQERLRGVQCLRANFHHSCALTLAMSGRQRRTLVRRVAKARPAVGGPLDQHVKPLTH